MIGVFWPDIYSKIRYNYFINHYLPDGNVDHSTRMVNSRENHNDLQLEFKIDTVPLMACGRVMLYLNLASKQLVTHET